MTLAVRCPLSPYDSWLWRKVFVQIDICREQVDKRTVNVFFYLLEGGRRR